MCRMKSKRERKSENRAPLAKGEVEQSSRGRECEIESQIESEGNRDEDKEREKGKDGREQEQTKECSLREWQQQAARRGCARIEMEKKTSEGRLHRTAPAMETHDMTHSSTLFPPPSFLSLVRLSSLRPFPAQPSPA